MAAGVNMRSLAPCASHAHKDYGSKGVRRDPEGSGTAKHSCGGGGRRRDGTRRVAIRLSSLSVFFSSPGPPHGSQSFRTVRLRSTGARSQGSSQNFPLSRASGIGHARAPADSAQTRPVLGHERLASSASLHVVNVVNVVNQAEHIHRAEARLSRAGYGCNGDARELPTITQRNAYNWHSTLW